MDALEHQNLSNVNELNEVRSSMQRVTKEKHELELRLTESTVGVECLSRQMKEKEAHIAETQKMCEHKETEN